MGLGLSLSKENDYRSRALSLDTRIASADNNTTWNFGIGRANDRIDPSNQRVSDERKRTGDYLIGVTQAWSPRDLVQANLTLSRGQGYFNDPYKTYDARPRPTAMPSASWPCRSRRRRATLCTARCDIAF